MNASSINNEEEVEKVQYQTKKKESQKKLTLKRKLQIKQKIHDLPKDYFISSSSLATSIIKANYFSEHEYNTVRPHESSSIEIPPFLQNYLPQGASVQQISAKMERIIAQKKNYIQNLRISRD